MESIIEKNLAELKLSPAKEDSDIFEKRKRTRSSRSNKVPTERLHYFDEILNKHYEGLGKPIGDELTKLTLRYHSGDRPSGK